jgi:hypothetical protein
VYIPSTNSDIFWLVLMNDYNDGGPYEWGGDIKFNSDASQVECDCGGVSNFIAPLVTDAWAEVVVELDLDNDLVEVSYDGTYLGNWAWSTGYDGNLPFGVLGFEAIDLYGDPNAIGTGYYDAVTVEPSVVGTNYCVANANSTGSATSIIAAGSASVALNALTLSASPCPATQNGLFFYGPNPAQLQFGNGFRCISAGATGIGRLPIVQADAGGVAAHAVDLTSPPTAATLITAGTTWYFQFWYRDPSAGGAFYNLSDGVQVDFLP